MLYTFNNLIYMGLNIHHSEGNRRADLQERYIMYIRTDLDLVGILA